MMSPAELFELAARFDLSDGDIDDLAERFTRRVARDLDLWHRFGTTENQVINRLRQLARRAHVNVTGTPGLVELANRMTDRSWWRRKLRERFRWVEQAERLRGAVHRRASPYASPKANRRHERQRRRLAEMMAALEAVNRDTGETLPMEQVIAASLANPANRRMAMMARIKGIERSAQEKGHEACMLAITAPGRMHARHEDGRAVARYDGSSPRQVQIYLHGVWSCALRQLKRRGLTCYGMRTVEPHHDATPHWHVLLFAPADQLAPVLDILRAHAMADSPNEPGAAEHRFSAERIDPAKGSALAYVAKYVAKSIDGHGLDEDNESGQTGADASRGVVVWAREWGIRQFQFFGQPPITPFRELHRLDGLDVQSEGLEAAHQACKANDYAGYLKAREVHGVDLACTYETRASARYPGELSQALRGLVAHALDLAAPHPLTTRTATWAIQPRPTECNGDPHAAPRTRITNSAPVVESTTYERFPAGQRLKPQAPARGRDRRGDPPSDRTSTGSSRPAAKRRGGGARPC